MLAQGNPDPERSRRGRGSPGKAPIKMIASPVGTTEPAHHHPTHAALPTGYCLFPAFQICGCFLRAPCWLLAIGYCLLAIGYLLYGIARHRQLVPDFLRTRAVAR
jgi:hypothetical protein